MGVTRNWQGDRGDLKVARKDMRWNKHMMLDVRQAQDEKGEQRERERERERERHRHEGGECLDRKCTKKTRRTKRRKELEGALSCTKNNETKRNETNLAAVAVQSGAPSDFPIRGLTRPSVIHSAHRTRFSPSSPLPPPQEVSDMMRASNRARRPAPEAPPAPPPATLWEDSSAKASASATAKATSASGKGVTSASRELESGGAAQGAGEDGGTREFVVVVVGAAAAGRLLLLLLLLLSSSSSSSSLTSPADSPAGSTADSPAGSTADSLVVVAVVVVDKLLVVWLMMYLEQSCLQFCCRYRESFFQYLSTNVSGILTSCLRIISSRGTVAYHYLLTPG